MAIGNRSIPLLPRGVPNLRLDPLPRLGVGHDLRGELHADRRLAPFREGLDVARCVRQPLLRRRSVVAQHVCLADAGVTDKHYFIHRHKVRRSGTRW